MVLQAIEIGNLHPLLVHLPIGIIVFAFFLEIMHLIKPKETSDVFIKYALISTAFFAALSLLTGWFLGDSGNYDISLLFRHRWLAVSFTVGTLALIILKNYEQPIVKKIYLIVFVSVMVLLGLTGHMGGSMTHGENFLTSVPPINNVEISNVNEAYVHNDIINPIFQRKCVGCHNAKKMEGGLLMTSPKELKKGGDSGDVLSFLENNQPLILKRLQLPIEDKEHMPPKGKVQPTLNEIELITWWLTNEHCIECKTKDLVVPEKLVAILKQLETDNSLHHQIAQEVDAVPIEWLEEMISKGISVKVLAKSSPLISVNFSNREDLEGILFKSLKSYADNIVEMNLSNSNFNDTLAKQLGRFKNITKLQLQNTRITDNVSNYISKLNKLESLNLYGTGVTDKILVLDSDLANLKNIYLWNTDVTDTAISQFAKRHPGVGLNLISDTLFAATSLQAPLIISDTDFFKDSIKVSLAYAFNDASLFYTLNGKEPDTTDNSYEKPFYLNKSAVVKAITYQKGWAKSETSVRDLKKSTSSYREVVLSNPPHEKYAANQGNTLVDLKRGTDNFVDGNWLGYEGEHVSTTMSLTSPTTISNIAIGALSAPDNWIFYPTGFTVWTSKDGTNYSLQASKQLAPQSPSNLIERRFFDVEIKPTLCNYVKIKIHSPLKNPSWHQEPGGKSWIFIDEVVLN